MALQFEHVLAGVRSGRWKKKGDAYVDRVPIWAQKPGRGCLPGGGQITQHRLRNLLGKRPRDTHHTDAAGPWGCRYGNDSVLRFDHGSAAVGRRAIRP